MRHLLLILMLCFTTSLTLFSQTKKPVREMIQRLSSISDYHNYVGITIMFDDSETIRESNPELKDIINGVPYRIESITMTESTDSTCESEYRTDCVTFRIRRVSDEHPELHIIHCCERHNFTIPAYVVKKH